MSSPIHTAAGTGQRRGFTLVEVAVALFVIGFGFSAVLAMFPTGAKWARQSSAQSIGARLAESYFNELRSQFAHIPGTHSGAANDNNTWSSAFNANDGWRDAGASAWTDEDSRRFLPRPNQTMPTTQSGLDNTYPMTDGVPTYKRRTRVYETAEALRSGSGVIGMPARETGGFYLTASATVATLFSRHQNMSNVVAADPTELGDALFAGHAAIRNAPFRLYDIYIEVYDGNPIELNVASDASALAKRRVATYRGRAWLGWQAPIE